MTNNQPETPGLRPMLTTRQRQALINDHEAIWLRGLRSKGFDAGHHPFLGAADSEAIERVFFRTLSGGIPLERNLSLDEFTSLCPAFAALPADVAERAVVAFSPTQSKLGAFISTCSHVMAHLDTVTAFTGYHLGVMSIDGNHGLAIERNQYTESGEHVPEGILLLRAWGGLALPL